jgi:hypothetical protein
MLGGIFLLACSPVSAFFLVSSTEEPEPGYQIITATSQLALVEGTQLAPTAVIQSTAEPETVSTEAGPPLYAVFPSDQLPDGKIVSLWGDPQGSLWLSGSQGVYRRDGEGWLALYTSPAGQILGQDDIGRVWVLLDDGTQIAAWRDGDWTVYDAKRGWQPIEGGGYLSRGFGDGLVMDEDDRLWLATGGNDLRRLDPANGLWTHLTARQIGFDPPLEEGYQGHFLTDVALSDSGKLWVADCIGVGESLDGQGIRRYTGQDWLGTDFTRNDCIFDLETGKKGVMWAGAVDALLRYSPITGSWSRIDLPIWGRFQVVVDVTLDEEGRPWIELLRAGGASLDGGAAHFYLDGDEWVPVVELSQWEPYTLLPAGDGTAWLFLEGVLYYFSTEGLQEIAPLPAQYVNMLVDRDGRLWVARLVTSEGQLWWYDPPQAEKSP